MPWVFPEVLGPVYHIALATEVVDSMGNALSIYTFLGTHSEVFLLFKAVTILDAVFEHLARFLAQGGMRLMVGLSELLPCGFKKAH